MFPNQIEVLDECHVTSINIGEVKAEGHVGSEYNEEYVLHKGTSIIIRKPSGISLQWRQKSVYPWKVVMRPSSIIIHPAVSNLERKHEWFWKCCKKCSKNRDIPPPKIPAVYIIYKLWDTVLPTCKDTRSAENACAGNTWQDIWIIQFFGTMKNSAGLSLIFHWDLCTLGRCFHVKMSWIAFPVSRTNVKCYTSQTCGQSCDPSWYWFKNLLYVPVRY